jgi:hypothetical protein
VLSEGVNDECYQRGLMGSVIRGGLMGSVIRGVNSECYQRKDDGESCLRRVNGAPL